MYSESITVFLFSLMIFSSHLLVLLSTLILKSPLIRYPQLITVIKGYYKEYSDSIWGIVGYCAIVKLQFFFTIQLCLKDAR